MSAGAILGGFFQRDWRVARSYRFPFVLDILGVIGALAVFFFIGEYFHEGFFAFALAGLLVLRMHLALARSILTLEGEIASGAMEETLAHPPSPFVYLLGTHAFETTRAIGYGLIMLAAAKLLFDDDLDTGLVALAAVVFGLLGAAAMFVALGAVIAGAVLVVRQGNTLTALVGLAFPILAGAYFPVSALPESLEAVAEVSPFRLPVDVIREALLDGTFAAGEAALLAAWCVALLVLGAITVRHGVAYGRRTAGLSRP